MARDLHDGLLSVGERSMMAVGRKHVADDCVRLIDNDNYRNAWSRFWLGAEMSLEDSPFSLKGKGRLIALLADVALPARALARRRGVDYFGYPATLHTDEWAPSADLLHLHNLHGGYFDLRALPTLTERFPTVLTLHDAWLFSGHCGHSFGCEKWRSGCGGCPDLTIPGPVRRDRTDWNWRVKREAFATSRVNVATPSRWLMDKVSASLLSPAVNDARVVPNGVDLRVFKPLDRKSARRKLQLPPDVPTAVFSSAWGQADPFKDFATLEAAALEAAQTLGGELVLVVLGGRTAESSEHRGDLRLVHVPYVADRELVATYLAAADLCVHTARAENFPLALAEAMACGTPAVSVRVGGIPEVVEDGITGVLVNAGDTGSFARAMVTLLRDHELRQAMSVAASEGAKRRLSLDRMVSTYRAWYHEIIEAKPAATA